MCVELKTARNHTVFKCEKKGRPSENGFRFFENRLAVWLSDGL
ncbi:hypothetical protein HMPREF9120_00908 [Neisseria sp. oral taxon 020 str. F0370]|nr:hypothetical protein HMPREF9120_00908 [Neisseria sp. oral taxon 020 str. F0370]